MVQEVKDDATGGGREKYTRIFLFLLLVKNA
jgi:hypothetical protein